MSLHTRVYLGLETGGAGELLKTGDPLANYGGFESPTAGLAGSYASGGDITIDGSYKIHTFTSTDDFVVSSQITNAEVLVVAPGGGGCMGGGGGGEVIHLTGVTIPADTYAMTIGEGGQGIYMFTSSGGEDGEDTVAFDGDALEKTAKGGGGGGAKTFSEGTGEDGHDGGCGGGGAGADSTPPGTTGGGSSTAAYEGNAGRGNGAYVTAYAPAGGGGGAGGAGSYPSGVQNGGNGGVGYLCDITGSNVRYGAGGGGGVYGYGYGGAGGTGGGGDGKARGGGNGEDATGYGCGGGGCGYFASGGDGADGVIIIRYLDAEEANFRGWTENHSTGHVFVEGSSLSDSTDGSVACKLIGPDYLTSEPEVCSGAEVNWFGFTIWSKGDGTHGVKYTVTDETGAATIISGETNSKAIWDRKFIKFQTPEDCVSISVKLETDSTTGVYIDDVSLCDFGPVVFTQNDDVLDDPKPQFGYGFNSNEPDDCVAGTGSAAFTLDNSSGKYSPEHASALDSFEEGMQVKMIIESDEWTDTNVLKNSGLELVDTDVSGYKYHAAITIDKDYVEADHTDFPVCVQGTFDGTSDEPDLRDTTNSGDIESVDDSGTISGADDVPADLIFCDDRQGTTEYSYEIEKYDKTTGEITAWVKIPTMDADTDLTFYMLYGNPAKTSSQEDINNVWSNYKAVYHFGEASGAAKDSVGNNDAAVSGSPTYRQTGQTGYAVTMDGNDYFRDSSADYYFSGQTRDTNVMMVADLNDNGSDQYLYSTGTSDGVYMRVDDSDSQKSFFKIDDGVDDDYGAGSTANMYSAGWKVWHHDIEGAVDHKGYIDGDLDYNGSVTSVGALADNPYIGARDTGTGGINGELCEYRARQSAGDADYIKTEANSILEASFLSVGIAVVFGLDKFEDWDSSGNGVVAQTTYVHDGSTAAILGGFDAPSYISQIVEVEPDLEYQLSFYAYEDYQYWIYDLDSNLLESGNGDVGASWTEVTDDCDAFGVAQVEVRVGVADGEVGIIDDISLKSRETNYTRTKFYGFIESIEPSSGKFDYPQTKVICRDWMGYCNQQEAGPHAIEASKTADYGITELLKDFEDQPQGIIFDTGKVEFDYIFHRQWSRSSMSRALWTLVFNEDGRLYSRGNGVLVFENADGRDDKTSKLTIDGEMSEFDIDYSTRNRYNSVCLFFRVKELSDTDVVWNAGDGVVIEANSTTIIPLYFKDPVTGDQLWCTGVTEPTAGNGNLVFSGANCTVDDFVAYGDMAIITITNAGAEETMTTCDIDADDAIRERSRVGIEDVDTDSVAKIGIKRWQQTLDLQDDIPTIKSRVENILFEWADSHISEATIRILANQNTSLAKKLIELEPNDKITAKESATGVDKDCYINYIEYEQDSTLLWVTLRADIIEV